MSSENETKAGRESLDLPPMPRETAELDYREEFSAEEFERISLGLKPQQMEDKWLIYLDGATLNFHRSWTGTCVYQVEFEAVNEKQAVRRAVANRDPDQYQWIDDAYDSSLLRFLISNLLLGREAEFPIPGKLSKKGPRGLFQHVISGTGFPERPETKRPWWKFWK